MSCSRRQCSVSGESWTWDPFNLKIIGEKTDPSEIESDSSPLSHLVVYRFSYVT